MQMTTSECVAIELRAELARRKVSVQRVAVALNKAKNWLYDRLNGRTPITVEELEVVCGHLDMTVGEIVRRAEELAASRRERSA